MAPIPTQHVALGFCPGGTQLRLQMTTLVPRQECTVCPKSYTSVTKPTQLLCLLIQLWCSLPSAGLPLSPAFVDTGRNTAGESEKAREEHERMGGIGTDSCRAVTILGNKLWVTVRFKKRSALQ